MLQGLSPEWNLVRETAGCALGDCNQTPVLNLPSPRRDPKAGEHIGDTRSLDCPIPPHRGEKVSD